MKRHFHFQVEKASGQTLVEYLATHTGLSKMRIKDVLQKGGVWMHRHNKSRQRTRRATLELQDGDILDLYYDESLLKLQFPNARKLWSCRDYSLWYKPPGLLAQGTEYGDHGSLLRQAQLAQPGQREVFLIHRLDREADGLMIIAHHTKAARLLSLLFQQQQVIKRYQVKVRGSLEQDHGDITLELEGKAAHTHYQRIDYDAAQDMTTVLVQISTGRTHQIRRHFDMIGHPVMGDPKYGQGNKNTDGLQLTAAYLEFRCPISHAQRKFDLDELLKIQG